MGVEQMGVEQMGDMEQVGATVEIFDEYIVVTKEVDGNHIAFRKEIGGEDLQKCIDYCVDRIDREGEARRKGKPVNLSMGTWNALRATGML